MTDDTSVDIIDTENLDAFTETFYGKAEAKEPVSNEDSDADTVATSEDIDASAETEDEDTPEEEVDSDDSDEQDDEPEKEEEEEPKGKNRKSAQARINEITKRAREAERREAALLQRLEALETRERNAPQEPIKEQLPQGAPTHDAVNEKGEPLYPLGEFDPNYVADLVRYTARQEQLKAREEMAREAEAARIAAAQAELQANWASKLDAVEEEIPEIREHISELVDTFQNIEPAYGEYLATTIMQCENGPLIMEYLSQNIGEAQKIVASGPAAATLAIGRLEAQLGTKPVAENSNNKKVSNAPRPPQQFSKGRKGNIPTREDTDDLDAFSNIFYAKK